MPFSLILDGTVAILLVVTITYAVILNKRLGRLREDKAELEGLASTFGQATARAQESIGRLKSTADELQSAIEKAESLRDDLAFLLDRGGNAADRLEQLVRRAREETGPGPAAGANGPQPAPADTVEPRSEAERELLRALQAAR